MGVFLVIIGVLCVLAGLGAAVSIRSDIQLILAIVFWGFAVVFFSLAALSEHLKRISKSVGKIVKAIEEPYQS